MDTFGRDIDWEKAHKIFYSERREILENLKNEIERYPYLKEILLILAAGTVISAAVLMPGIGHVLRPSIWRGRGYKKDRLRQTLKRLHRQKFVEVVETKDGPVVKISEKGITRALKYKLDKMEIKHRDSWDKKWRIVIFDIPDSKKRIRDEFREKLKQLGFFRLQESVFVHAFPCFDEVEFLREIYGIGRGVTYIVAQKIEGQESLKDFFRVT